MPETVDRVGLSDRMWQAVPDHRDGCPESPRFNTILVLRIKRRYVPANVVNDRRQEIGCLVVLLDLMCHDTGFKSNYCIDR